MKLVTQLENDGCLRACLAMVAGVEYSDVPERVKYSMTDARAWLWERGIEAHPLLSASKLESGHVYLVCVPSLNLMSQFHEVVIDCQTEPYTLLDPRDGCDGKIPYTLSTMYRRNQYIVEYEIIRLR